MVLSRIINGEVLVLLSEALSPVDQCGCGDTGYLTSRTLPIALNLGAGKVINVPVYTCSSSMCDEYTIPSAVAPRLDEIAEEMEAKELLSIQFSWKPTLEDEASDYQDSLAQGFIWRFHRRSYEDAQVLLVINGDTILLQSKIDPTEYYTLKRLEDSKEGIQFSFSKFFEEDQDLTYEKFIELEPSFQKEIGTIKMEELEDMLLEEFGETID
ncbi:hypothetical protein Desdi_2184 [Desulfitobacterium dichloroeliminans LMG P-21439]|uniref:Uncharacterized protein n=2 Tax=Desulfitobacterium dichloroeliminans TaxID=233055 RepID=L0F9D3_DESDL|nr:hypothetical protein Desdi_2184 [Desulfitobacterium dichloroeliminans LMG P-21439]